MTIDTRFATGSISKMAVAITALRLVDRGVLDLHRPVTEILPAEHQPVSLTPKHTMHHLLSHTSGIGNYHDQDLPSWDSFVGCWDRIPTYHLRTAADMLPLFADAPAVFEPGEKFLYTDANFLVAALVIEAASGLPFAQCAADEVFTPLGLSDTEFGQLDTQPARMATGYMVTDEPPHTWKSNIYSVPAGSMPDGGMISSATDLARLIDALDNGEMLSPELTLAMTSPQAPATEDIDQYGYGCEVVVQDGAVTIIGHGGHDPGIMGMVSRYRTAGITVVALSNYDKGMWAVYEHIVEMLGVDDPRE